jgi:hypothetical protein
MTTTRHKQALEAFLNSREAQQPLIPNPLHDPMPSAPPSTRELAERKARLAQETDATITGRDGYVPHGGSIAQTPTRHVAAISEQAGPTAAEQQAAIIAVMRSMNATQSELEQMGHQLKNSPRLRELDEWVRQLEKLRKFRGGQTT